MFNDLLPVVQTINACLSDYILVFLLMGVGLFYSIRTRFVQIRCFGEGLRRVFGNFSINGKAKEGQMSSFQALATAIAAQVGTGNIVGACGAILTGGPGAIFWMWIIAFFGMATIYAEAVLAQVTRVKQPNGTYHGGPVYYIHKAFPGTLGRVLAVFFAVAITLALGFMGCMVQSNSIGETSSLAFGVPAWGVGLVIATLSGFVFLGGVKRIAAITEKLVPLMALLYIAGSLTMLLMNVEHLVEAFGMIFYYAFNPEAIIGGSWGAALKTAISQGAKRGLFSNEAGMGSTPHAHALAHVKQPHDQGVIAMAAAYEYAEVEDILRAARDKNEPPFIFLLDNIEDPHNLGAMIRTANLAGAHGVIIPKNRAVGLTATVARTSAGALNYTPVAKVTNLSKTIEDLKKEGMWFVCADMGGTTMYDLDLKGPIGLVIGNEGEGVGRLVKEKCDYIASIPMKGNIDSLNASVAAGILAYEIVRQRFQ